MNALPVPWAHSTGVTTGVHLLVVVQGPVPAIRAASISRCGEQDPSLCLAQSSTQSTDTVTAPACIPPAPGLFSLECPPDTAAPQSSEHPPLKAWFIPAGAAGKLYSSCR